MNVSPVSAKKCRANERGLMAAACAACVKASLSCGRSTKHDATARNGLLAGIGRCSGSSGSAAMRSSSTRTSRPSAPSSSYKGGNRITASSNSRNSGLTWITAQRVEDRQPRVADKDRAQLGAGAMPGDMEGPAGVQIARSGGATQVPSAVVVTSVPRSANRSWLRGCKFRRRQEKVAGKGGGKA